MVRHRRRYDYPPRGGYLIFQEDFSKESTSGRSAIANTFRFERSVRDMSTAGGPAVVQYVEVVISTLIGIAIDIDYWRNLEYGNVCVARIM